MCSLSPRVSSLLFLLLVALPLVSAAAQTCYYPNGAIASDQVPCSDAQGSACCHKNAICLSNNLCLGIKQPFILGRGACTDPDWQSEKCPQQCQTAQPQSGCSIVLLNSTAGVNSYCCNSLVVSPGHDQPVCDVGSPFTLSDATPVAGRGALAAISSPSSSSSTSSSTTSSSTSSTSSSTGATSTPTDAPACNTSTAATTPTTDKSQPYRETAIGVGVGVPLGAIAVGLLIWAMWERRERKRTEQDLNVARGLDATGAKDYLASSSHWQGQPPSFAQSQRQSRIRELYHGREPAELH